MNNIVIQDLVKSNEGFLLVTIFTCLFIFIIFLSIIACIMSIPDLYRYLKKLFPEMFPEYLEIEKKQKREQIQIKIKESKLVQFLTKHSSDFILLLVFLFPIILLLFAAGL